MKRDPLPLRRLNNSVRNHACGVLPRYFDLCFLWPRASRWKKKLSYVFIGSIHPNFRRRVRRCRGDKTGRFSSRQNLAKSAIFEESMWKFKCTYTGSPLNDAMKTLVSHLLMTSRNVRLHLYIGKNRYQSATMRAAQRPYTLTCYRLAGVKATDSPEIKPY
ncbi:unnamed protein product, partial [Mesorhabditis spiculigera]